MITIETNKSQFENQSTANNEGVLSINSLFCNYAKNQSAVHFWLIKQVTENQSAVDTKRFIRFYEGT